MAKRPPPTSTSLAKKPPVKPDGAGQSPRMRQSTAARRPPPPPAQPRAVAGRAVRLRATADIYHNHVRVRPGDVFSAPADGIDEYLRKGIAELVDGNTPERTTTGNEHIAAQHDAILGAKVSARAEGREPPAVKAATDDDELI